MYSKPRDNLSNEAKVNKEDKTEGSTTTEDVENNFIILF